MPNGKPIAANLDAERRYLTSMATFNDYLLEGSYIRVDPEDLYLIEHQMILTAIYDVENRSGRPPEFQILVDHYIQDTGYLKNHGGVDTFRDLISNNNPSLALQSEAMEIKRLAKVRTLEKYGSVALRSLHEQKTEEALASFQNAILIAQTEDSAFEGTAYDAAWNALQEIKSGRQNKITFGIYDVDEAIGGVSPGTMTVIGGTTGIGKSAMMLLAALKMAENGHRPGIVSVEDTEHVWGSRILAEWSDLSPGVIFGFEKLNLPSEQLDELFAYAEARVSLHTDTPISFRYEIGSTANSVLNAVSSLVRKDRCDIVFVDYIQAIRVDLTTSRYDKSVSDIAKQLKGLCHRLRVPLVLGSQLNRNWKNMNKEPTLFSLKESGDLENEAEVVLLAWGEITDCGLKIPKVRLAKLKWGPSGQKFVIERGQNGMICDVRRDYENE